ncbi:MAG TPA: NPCBM/NEW2 domain-containing protein [Tepidisphaeraceae bacterium]|jgi:hypothetical protein|nr:NPCBM/NEW2 domain-containing protein [Tepidisphaeraceae bacterium]
MTRLSILKAWCFGATLVTLTATASVALADGPWTMTDADLQRVSILSDMDIKDGNVMGQTASGVATVPLARVVSLSSGKTAAVPQGLFVLHMADGQQIVGSPAGSTAESVIWTNEKLGDRTVPLSSVVQVSRSLTPPAPAELLEDAAKLANGDTVRGVVSTLDNENVTFTVGDAEVPVALANLTSIRFASTGEPAPATAAAFAVTLADGSTVFADAVTKDGDDWTVRLDGGEVAVPADGIVRVDHLNGPARWLSSLPAQVQYTPYLGESFPPKVDRSADGGAIRAEGRTYDRGIGMHARTRMTFALDGTFPTFRTRYAAEPGLALTDAVVRVLVDDKVAHESRVRGGQVSQPVELDVSAAKTLTLEVDFGAGLHTQDRVNWIEPALLKSRPEPATTQP